jgi:hypothetical protein
MLSLDVGGAERHLTSVAGKRMGCLARGGGFLRSSDGRHGELIRSPGFSERVEWEVKRDEDVGGVRVVEREESGM